MNTKGKIFKIIGLSFAGFIGLFLITTLTVVFVFPYLSFTNSKKQHVDWMKDLDDEQLITELVLPGSHDSTTNICDLPYFTKTQYMNIDEQLNIGVRSFDMRLVIEKDKIKFTHSTFNCKETPFKNLYLDKVCDLMYDFLDKNPSETIVFLSKHEHGNEPITLLEDIFESTINEKKSYWYLSNEIPKLKDVRGKIVLLARYDTRLGIKADWPNQSGAADVSETYDVISYGDYDVCIQDRYEYKKKDKWNAFTSELPTLTKTTFVFNYLSTTEGAFSNPRSISLSMNKKFLKYDIPDSFKGTIMLDYINSDLTEKIINAN